MKKISVLAFLCVFILSSAVLAGASIRLTILNFDNLTNLPDYDYLEPAIPQMLVTNLKPSTRITLIERSQLDRILQEHSLSQSGAIDEKTAVQIGQLTGADHILLGSVFQAGEQIRLDARIIETASSKITLAEKVTTSEERDLIDAIDELGRLILLRLANETLTPLSAQPEIFQPIGDEVLSIYTAMDNLYKPAGSDQPNYLLIDIKAGRMTRQEERIPLNICMVIDKSGSMEAQNKLENVKKAALFVVDHLKPTDYFSVITYDTQVYYTIPSTPANDKNALKATINEITPGSSTNLSGGMMEGYTQVQVKQKPGMVNRVLLLSDGLANTGIIDPARLKEIVSSHNSQGLTLSTFGVGSDFNEDLMTTLAEYGGGNYYFIDNPDEIATIFSQELFGLLSVVAQNAQIYLQLNQEIKSLQTFGYPSVQSGNVIEVKLNDVFSEEEKTVIFKLAVPSGSNADVAIGVLKVTYDDVVVQNKRIVKTFSPVIIVTGDRALIASGNNKRVMDNIVLYESASMLNDAIANVDRRDYDSANSINAQNLLFLQQQVSHDSPKELKQQILNVMKYQTEAKQAETMKEQDLKLMQKGVKFENYQQIKKKENK